MIRKAHVRVGARVAALLVLTVSFAAGCQHARHPGTERVARQSSGCGGRSGDLSDEDVRQTRATHVEELLSGRVAGVRVIPHPNGGFSVRIRGTRSIMGNNEPLYVVDGMPIEVGARGMLGLSPWDVECIEVLKDAGSTAFYGVRGANGVVLITTRRPG